MASSVVRAEDISNAFSPADPEVFIDDDDTDEDDPKKNPLMVDVVSLIALIYSYI